MKFAMAAGGFSEAAIRLRLDVKRSTFNGWLNDKSEPKFEKLLEFCEIVGTTIDQIVRRDDDASITPELQRLTDDDDMIKIDVINGFFEPGDEGEVPTEKVIGQFGFQTSWLDQNGIQASAARIVAVETKHMEPVISKGSIVMIDTRWTDIEKRGLYAVRQSEAVDVFEVEVRWIGKGKDRRPEWALRSIAPTHPTSYVSGASPADFAILGKVVWVSRMWPHRIY